MLVVLQRRGTAGTGTTPQGAGAIGIAMLLMLLLLLLHWSAIAAVAAAAAFLTLNTNMQQEICCANSCTEMHNHNMYTMCVARKVQQAKFSMD